MKYYNCKCGILLNFLRVKIGTGIKLWRLPRWFSGKESAWQCRRHKGHSYGPWIRQISCRKKWQLVPVFLPEKSHGQKSLVGYSWWGHKASDTIEWRSNKKINQWFYTCLFIYYAFIQLLVITLNFKLRHIIWSKSLA